ncbi:hypothetical protein V8E36_000520 [Tilletia maclaganii]
MPLAAPRSAPAKLPRVLGDDEVPVSKKHWDEMQDKLYEQGKRPKKLARLTEASKKAGSEMEGYKQAVKNKNDEVNIMVVKLKQAVIAHEKLLHDQDLLSMDYKNATVELAKRAQEYNAVCPERARLGRDLGTEAPPPEQTSAMDSVRVLSDQLEASLRSVLADPISTSAMAADGVLAERPGLAEDHHSAGGTSVMTPRPVNSTTNVLATISPSLIVSQPLAYLYLCWTGVIAPSSSCVEVWKYRMYTQSTQAQDDSSQKQNTDAHL